MYNNLSTTTSSSSSNCQNSSTNSSTTTQQSSSQQQLTSGGPIAKDTHQCKIIQDTLSDCYVHWCVDANKFETKLNHIPIFSLKDVKFIYDLKAAYNSVMGIRCWFSLTSCYGVKLIIVRASLNLRHSSTWQSNLSVRHSRAGESHEICSY